MVVTTQAHHVHERMVNVEASLEQIRRDNKALQELFAASERRRQSVETKLEMFMKKIASKFPDPE